MVPAAYVFLVRGGADPAGPCQPGGLAPDTEVLLQLRQNTGYMDGYWAAGAAGHVERGEMAYDAARRETREELGVTDPELAFHATVHRTQGAAPIDERVDFFFTARDWSGEPRIIEPEKCAELRWCRLDSLPEPVVPHERVVLDGLRGGDLPAYVALGFRARRAAT